MRKVSIITRQEAEQLPVLGSTISRCFDKSYEKYILVQGNQRAIGPYTKWGWFKAKYVYGLKYLLRPW